jgi:ribonuclease D
MSYISIEECATISAKMPDTRDLPPASPCAAHFITDLPDLQELAARLLACPLVAVDTESDSLYSYSEKICLVQFSIPDADYIVDPLTTYSLEPLAEVFANPSIEKIFHGADYDLVSLKRGYGFHFANIFDTMIASRILGRKGIGLAALVAQHMGLAMDKSQQRSDWGRRPLTAEQLAYACLDTRYLIPLRDHLLGELRELGREQEAREAFADLANLDPRMRSFDPDAFWNVKGVRDLDVAGQHIMRALHRWREDQARSEDRPMFKVIHDRSLVEIASAKPATLDALRQSHLISSYQVTRYGRQIMDIVNKARRETEHLQPPSQRRGGARPDDVILDIYEHLRSWRKERALARGVEPDVIASNDLLMKMATLRPQTMADLEAIAGLGAWRRAEYGADILSVISSLDRPVRKRRS